MTSKGQTGKKEAEEINGGVDMKKLGELTDSELLTLEKSWDEKKWTTEENTLFWYAIVQEIIRRFQQVVDKKENGYVLAKITIKEGKIHIPDDDNAKARLTLEEELEIRRRMLGHAYPMSLFQYVETLIDQRLNLEKESKDGLC